ncbi:Histidine kinase [Leptospira interrogans serovar Canicola]|nr:Histidine kinase [Leptospira interrogans serovar Canicola]
MILVWYGQYQKALILTLFTVVVGITLGLFFGDPDGNALYSFPILVIIFLLFTSIRTTIYISIYSFILIFYFLLCSFSKGNVKNKFCSRFYFRFFLFYKYRAFDCEPFKFLY